jgi:hypothetical protein
MSTIPKTQRMKNRIPQMLLLAGAVTFTSIACKSKKEIPTPKGEVEIVLPCSQFKSDKNYFRSYSFGESTDANVAKKKALSNAREELAGQISSTMKVVGDNYVKSSEFNNVEEVLERFEQNSRTVINERLSGIKPVCDKLMQVTATGKYKYYVALELSGEDLVDDYYKTLSNDQSLKIDYNYEKFKQTFDAEMAKMENQ